MPATYLTPGVYVEEVPSRVATLSAGATAVAAFVGFTAKAPKDDPTDPGGLKPRLVTNWTPVRGAYGGFVAGRDAPALGLRLLQQRRQRWPTSCASRTPSRPSEPGQLALPVRRPRPRPGASSSRPSSRTPTSRSPSRPSRPPTTPTTTPADLPRSTSSKARRAGRELQRRHAAAASQRRRSTASVDQGQGRDQDRRRPARRRPARRCRPARSPSSRPRPRRSPCPAGRSPAPSRPAPASAASSIADDVTMVMVPDLVTAATKDDGSDRPRPVEVRAAGAHQPLRGPGQPHGRARRASRACRRSRSRSGAATTAMYDSPFAALYYPWIKVAEPGGHQRRHRDHGPAVAATWPASGPAPTTPAASGRRRPTRSSAAPSTSRRTSPRPSRACSTRSASTASVRSAPRASGCGARARCRRTPTGRTSTSAACST